MKKFIPWMMLCVGMTVSGFVVLPSLGSSIPPHIHVIHSVQT
ncbi:MAG: hypothetical protein OWS03_06160 [Alicyclobacillaceae bacterium]|nr:hypothetical protein [Alicyclobacillus sp. SP_1]MCY0895863.1 hypothetical protein [Alicyclobacillaceae bacterium]